MKCKNFNDCNNIAIPGQTTCTKCQLLKKDRWKIKANIMKDSAELSAADRKYAKNSALKMVRSKNK